MKSSERLVQIIVAIMLLVGLMPLGNTLNNIKEDAGLADRFIQRPVLGFDSIAWTCYGLKQYNIWRV